jgi:hypothetical protein
MDIWDKMRLLGLAFTIFSVMLIFVDKKIVTPYLQRKLDEDRSEAKALKARLTTGQGSEER